MFSSIVFFVFRFIDHGDGLVVLRVIEPLAIDSGLYSCVIASEYGCCVTSTEVTIDPVDETQCEKAPEFIKELVPVVAMHGSVIAFCARVSPPTSHFKWTICGREINENSRGMMVSISFKNRNAKINDRKNKGMNENEKKKIRKEMSTI